MTTNTGGRIVWLSRAGWAGAGALAMLIAGVVFGRVEFGGDFAANVAGATIGGAISVLLAVKMFSHQRDIAERDAREAAGKSWAAAIRESLRYIRAIREGIIAGKAITKKNSEGIIRGIDAAAKLTRRALGDVNLTDFPLRIRMEEAAELGEKVAHDLQMQMYTAVFPNENAPLMAAATICDPAIVDLNKLIADYTQIRNVPAV